MEDVYVLNYSGLTANYHLIGKGVSVELFVMWVSRRPADAHALINIPNFYPPSSTTHAAIKQPGQVNTCRM